MVYHIPIPPCFQHAWQLGLVSQGLPREIRRGSSLLTAWSDIHSHRDVPLVKDPTFYDIVKLGSDGAPSIFNADQQNHRRVRKQLAHAFSEKALRDQEPSMKAYVDLLIEKLRDVAASGRPADMVQWYNFTTFDLIGDLAIGKSFDCLNNSQYHSWVNGIWKSIKIGPYIRTMATYTDIQRLMRVLAPKSIKEARARHERYVQANAQERINKGVMEERKDFLSYILGNRGEKGALTDKEVAANCGFLILAGSETTATALSGVTYYLLKTPEALQKATAEVRNAFDKEEEINFVNASARLPYTQACLTEGLRIYPPGPTMAPRRTPKGVMTIIAGYQVPGWVSLISFPSWTASSTKGPFHSIQ
jgi:cytochrome P450